MKTTNTDVLKSLLFDRIPKPRKFEDRLWSAADNLRASARLKSSEYAAPLLGLFFLRYASNRFGAIKAQAEQEFETSKDSRNSETIEEIYKRLCGFYLPDAARYETLLNLTDADNVQQSVIEAMNAFETENQSLEVSLPKNEYLKIPHKTLRDILDIISEITVIEGDVFGKIYEYFLGKFALSEGQKGGEFYTPTSVVKLIVEVIEPFKADARVFDPACGTGGMFVQSAKFVEQHVGMQRLSIYGQEKVDETANLGTLNLFINGLKGDIRKLNSSLDAAAYTDDYADTLGKFDFVMANPPFNVDTVKVEDIGNHPLFATYGLPLGKSKSGKKSDTFSNANYLWISLFATALNETGRAGFVMANSASDARGGELDVRGKMVEAGLVDVMITLGPNFFYTVTLPVTLWFFDRAKTKDAHTLHDQTLFIDARRIYSTVHGSRTLREFSQAQLLNIASIVWLYRDETEKFQELRELYKQARERWRDGEVTNEETRKTYKGVVAHREQLAGAFRELASKLVDWRAGVESQLTGEARAELSVDAERRLEALRTISAEELTDRASINEMFKRAEESVTFADKVLRPPKDKTFTKADIRGALRRLADERDDALFVLERVGYFEEQTAWLDTNFPKGVWRDVEGLCRIASRAEIEEQGFSLNPGRYVGVDAEDDGMTAEEFRALMETNAATLARLHAEADELQRHIAEDLRALFAEKKAEAV